MHKVSVIMNCFNGEKYLREAIDSVYQQTYANWEIIFIDNASTDNSAEIAKSYDHRLRYYNTHDTLPLYGARNIGLQYVTGEFVTFLDVDDTWSSNKLFHQLKIMAKHPDVYLVCSGYFRKNEKRGTLSRSFSFRSKFITFSQVLHHYPVALSSVMLRYDLHSKEIIHFNQYLNITGDYELFLRLIYHYKAYFISFPLITLRIHETNLSKKLLHDWPNELSQTYARLKQDVPLTSYQTLLIDKCYAKASGKVHLAQGETKAARAITKKYIFRDARIMLIYLSTYNTNIIKWLQRIQGF